MREIKFRAISKVTGKYIYGLPRLDENGKVYAIQTFENPNLTIGVFTETLGEFTGLTDKNGKEIYDKQKVKLILDDYELVGNVCQECGAWGIACDEINYDELEKHTEFGNKYRGCYNDNFLSFWEIIWNLEVLGDFEGSLKTIEIIGNIYEGDNHE